MPSTETTTIKLKDYLVAIEKGFYRLVGSSSIYSDANPHFGYVSFEDINRYPADYLLLMFVDANMDGHLFNYKPVQKPEEFTADFFLDACKYPPFNTSDKVKKAFKEDCYKFVNKYLSDAIEQDPRNKAGVEKVESVDGGLSCGQRDDTAEKPSSSLSTIGLAGDVDVVSCSQSQRDGLEEDNEQPVLSDGDDDTVSVPLSSYYYNGSVEDNEQSMLGNEAEDDGLSSLTLDSPIASSSAGGSSGLLRCLCSCSFFFCPPTTPRADQQGSANAGMVMNAISSPLP